MDFGMSFEQFIDEKVSKKARVFNTLDNNEPTEQDYESAAEAYRKASDGE